MPDAYKPDNNLRKQEKLPTAIGLITESAVSRFNVGRIAERLAEWSVCSPFTRVNRFGSRRDSMVLGRGLHGPVVKSVGSLTAVVRASLGTHERCQVLHR